MENLIYKQDTGKAILEPRTEPLYYRALIAVNASSVKFFGSVDSANKLITNIVSSGQVGSPNEFYVQGIGLHPQEGVPTADLEKLYNYSVLSLSVAGREKWTGPTFLVPNPCSLQGAATTTATTTTISKFSNVSANNGAYYPLVTPSQKGLVPIVLDSLTNFSVELSLFLPSDFSTTFYCWALLFGYFNKGR